jgi:hypothetical protein
VVEKKCHFCSADLSQFVDADGRIDSEHGVRAKDEDCNIFVCKACYKEREDEFGVCNSCDSPVLNGRQDNGGELFCNDCYYETYEFCSRCDCEVFRDDAYSDDDGNSYCPNCWEDSNRSSLKEHADRLVDVKKLTEGDSFKVFGVELEAIAQDEYESRDSRLNHFTVVEDGSLNEQGLEFVSVPLPNPRGFKVIHDFCSDFAREHLHVDGSCGYHVHLFVHPSLQTAKNLKKIWLAYHRLEQFFFSMVPTSRRNNSYCRSLQRNFLLEKIAGKRSLKGLLGYYYSKKIRNVDRDTDKSNKYNDKRYYWVNLHSILHRNTLEIRLHNGTLNGKKVVYWYMMHRKFLEWVLKFKTSSIMRLDSDELVSRFLYHVLTKKLRRYVFSRVGKFSETRFGMEDLFSGFNFIR